MASAKWSSPTVCWAPTNSQRGFAGSSAVRITSTYPFPGRSPDRALGRTARALILQRDFRERRYGEVVRTKRLLRGWCTNEGGRERPEGKGPRHTALPRLHPSPQR